ncbi:hypothetical protein AWW66_31880 [Micromonospora rosaria]|uniref:Uncharacterized protein n=1 Tax=Micromonospora rosaria TaxID=47874 RepID=A0A136PI66_9ACTN|nr:DUF5956 family protein [Micromonospora rosaria]KXK58089.1 hypothetical protein AWW66_31880 [Micromonospora rosaria]
MPHDQSATESTWDDVPVRDDPPGSGYHELTDNGLGALIGWLSGAGRLVRCPDRLPYMTIEACTGPGGETRQTRPRTPDDQRVIDDSVNDYLHDAGVPARPTGYRWFLRLPMGISGEQVESTVISAIGQLPADHVRPSQQAPRIREVLEALHADEPGLR